MEEGILVSVDTDNGEKTQKDWGLNIRYFVKLGMTVNEAKELT